MIPIRWTSQVDRSNWRWLLEQVDLHGGRIIEYRHVWSFLLISMSSPQYVWLPPGRSRRRGGWNHTVFSLAFGWWSLPGLIWTPAVVLYNCLGGADVTALLRFAERPVPPPMPAAPPPLPGALRASLPPPVPAAQRSGVDLVEEELQALQALNERDRFRKLKLGCGLGLILLIPVVGFLLSQFAASHRPHAPRTPSTERVH